MKGERVAQLELLLRSHPEGIRRAEIARRLGVHRSTVSRYVEELGDHLDIYEENNLIKLRDSDTGSSPMELSIYESLAFNMGAEVLADNSEYANPHLASGLRKLAMNMRSYAPEISNGALALADRIDLNIQRNRSTASQYNQVLEVLIDCWMSGRLARIHTTAQDNPEVEIAPYFIGFKEDQQGRKPITVTGRLRHTKDIVTIDISCITEAKMLDETYTIPDNLKPFAQQSVNNAYDAVDMIPLTLKVKEKSALNTFSTLMHGKPELTKQEDGSELCKIEVENSIELTLRLIQCGTAVEILAPESFRNKFVARLKDILAIYSN